MREGDVIVDIDGEAIEVAEDLGRVLDALSGRRGRRPCGPLRRRGARLPGDAGNEASPRNSWSPDHSRPPRGPRPGEQKRSALASARETHAGRPSPSMSARSNRARRSCWSINGTARTCSRSGRAPRTTRTAAPWPTTTRSGGPRNAGHHGPRHGLRGVPAPVGRFRAQDAPRRASRLPEGPRARSSCTPTSIPAHACWRRGRARALTIALCRAVGEDGRVVSYELREEHRAQAHANVESFFGKTPARLDMRAGDVIEAATGEERFDRVVLDLPEPWTPLERCRRSSSREPSCAPTFPPRSRSTSSSWPCPGLLPPHRDVRSAEAWVARDGAERAAGPPDGRSHRLPDPGPRRTGGLASRKYPVPGIGLVRLAAVSTEKGPLRGQDAASTIDDSGGR